MKIGGIALAIIAAMIVASFAIAQTTEQENAAEDLKQADAVAKRHRDELMKIPHVRVVTGEVDARNDAAILVQIDDQKNYDSVARQLPSEIEGFPVEVDENESAVSMIGVGASPKQKRFPTIDKNGYYHHWFQDATPLATPEPPQ
jgi:hypothetical protein